MNKRKAFVEVSYMDSGPAMAGSGYRDIPRAEVYEVYADDEPAALKAARERIEAYPMAGNIRTRFLRWV